MKSKGFTILEFVVVVSILAIISILIRPNFSLHLQNAQRDVHIMNSRALAQAVQTGTLEGWISIPAIGKTTDVTIQNLLDQNTLVAITDPSPGLNKPYATSSIIQIYNNSTILEYYILLKNEDSSVTYLDTIAAQDNQGSTQIRELQRTNVSLY
jgi:prepilin-type N-terminal cleavage/methylation domain-containing protein